MNRHRPTHLRVVGAMPGVHDVCALCHARVRRFNGLVYESTSDRYHACHGAWDVLPPVKPSWWQRVCERVAGWLA